MSSPSQDVPSTIPSTSSGPVKNRQQALLHEARRCASFDVSLLTAIIYGSAASAREHEHVRTEFEKSVGEGDSSVLPKIYSGLNREDYYHDGLGWGKAHIQDASKQAHTQFTGYVPKYGLFSVSPYGHQYGLFGPAMTLLAAEDQYAQWWPLVRDCKILCTYAQTELGHGTLVRGLETTATLDERTDEIVINTPTISATKYWPGGMGYTASHALVMARLLVKGKDQGIHGFMVQIRSLEDYKSMPGIEAGDLGMKVGWNSTDNGYLSFNHVRIPRTNMLMRHAKLSEGGRYTPSPNDKLLYGGLTASRVTIVNTSAFELAQAATIATRYSFVREQGFMGGEKEVQIMQYKSQHYRLLKHISATYAMLFVRKDLEETYAEHETALHTGDLSKMAYTHFATSGLKAYCTEVAAAGAEDCRRSVGGHGYSFLSGLPLITGEVVPLVTLEGENYVMYQQAAQYLVKAARAARAGQQVHPNLAYLLDRHEHRCLISANFDDPATLIRVYRHRAARLIFECEEALRLSYQPEADAWNTNMMQLLAASRAHIQLGVLESFVQHVSRIQDSPLRAVMQNLCSLYALTDIESPTASGSMGFVEDGYVTYSQIRDIRRLVNDKLDVLVPEAVGLTDAWNFSDASLQSAIGQKDGNAYETLMAWTKQLPMNVKARRNGGVDQAGFEGFIRPILRDAHRAKL